MLIETQIFENILTVDEQNILLEFMVHNYKNWTFIPYVSLSVNDKPNLGQVEFPAYTIDVNKKNFINYDNIFTILKKIEINVSKNVDLKFLQNYRYKLNCQPPIDIYTTNDLYKNIHYDSHNKHVVMIYYANDCDGDTLLFKNKRGWDIISNNKTKKEVQNGIFDNIELIQSITPKKGRVVIFDGALLHSAGWSNTKNRYAVNFNIILDDNNKKINLI